MPHPREENEIETAGGAQGGNLATSKSAHGCKHYRDKQSLFSQGSD
jgi:hypothetical protein